MMTGKRLVTGRIIYVEDWNRSEATVRVAYIFIMPNSEINDETQGDCVGCTYLEHRPPFLSSPLVLL